MRNLVLIHPYMTAANPETYLSEPLGLICLASHLDAVFKDEINVTILDLYALGDNNPQKVKKGLYCLGLSDPNEISKKLKLLKPDLIGIHCNFTAYAQDSLEVSSICKQCMPEVPVVMGGAHPTIVGKNILKQCESVDYVVKGEGEIILEHFVRALKGEMKINEVNGLIYRKGKSSISRVRLPIVGVYESIVENKPMELVKDLDDLPIPDRRYIDMDFYSHINQLVIWYTRKKPIATIMTSRGCPYDCVFCSTKVVWTRKWRYRTLENVFEEIQMLYDDYGVREFVINDDQFMTRKGRIHAFCEYFMEKKLDIAFSVDSGISVWLVDHELLKKMKKAGFYALRFPIESGSKKTLEYVNKPVNLDNAKQLIDTANRLGFWTSSNIIVGFPYETREDILESIKYVYDSSLDFTSFIVAHPNAGAEMYNDFQKEGLMDENVVRASDFYSSDYDTVNLKSHEIAEMVRDATNNWFIHKLKFYLVPNNFFHYLLPKLQSVDDIRYFLTVFFSLVERKLMPIMKKQKKKLIQSDLTRAPLTKEGLK